MRHFTRILGTLLAVAIITCAGATTAHARPDPGGDGSDSGSRGATSSVCGSASAGTVVDPYYLPVQRWQGATQTMHVRSNGGFIDTAGIQRQAQSLYFTIGDFNYSVTTMFVTWGLQFCPLEKVGGAIDGAAATFGTAISKSTVLSLLVVIALFAFLGAGLRGQGGQGLKQLGSKLMVIALFSAMIAGAVASTGGGKDGSTAPYKPGTMSPGWIATTIDRIITEIAAGPAASVSNDAVIDTVAAGGDQLDCSNYLKALQNGYQTKATTEGQVLSSRAVPAMTVSNLWQISAYNAWSVAQFGDKNLNGQQRVACRMLDHNAAIPVGIGSFRPEGMTTPDGRSAASVTEVMARVGHDKGRMPLSQARDIIKTGAPAWRQLNAVEQDKAWVAWATCIPQDGKLTNITREDGWSAPKGNSWLIHDDDARKNAEAVNGSGKLNTACFKFFNDESDTVDGIFDWGDGDKELKKHQSEMPASVYNFLGSLHGTDQGAAGAAAMAYAVGSFGVLLVFGGIALAVVIVKIIALMMLFLVMIVALFSLWPGSSNEKLVKLFKQYVGLTLYSAFAVFVLAIVTLFVKILFGLVGGLTGGPNSVMTMLLGGLLPVIAAAGLHVAFKVVNVPSPLTVQGAMGWGQSLSAGAYTGAAAEGSGKLLNHAGAAAGSLLGKKGGSGAAAVQAARRKGAKTNAELGSGSQKGPIAGVTPLQAKDNAQKKAANTRDPFDILKDPNASVGQKRQAQRDLRSKSRAERDELQSLKAAAAKTDAAPTVQTTNIPTTKPSLGTRARRSAGQAGRRTAQSGRAARVWAAQSARDRLLDMRRWPSEQLQAIKADPKAAARRAAVTAAKAAGVSGLMVGATALGGVPGALLMGGAISAARSAPGAGRGASTVSTAAAERYQSRTQRAIAEYKTALAKVETVEGRLVGDGVAPAPQRRQPGNAGQRPPKPGPRTHGGPTGRRALGE